MYKDVVHATSYVLLYWRKSRAIQIRKVNAKPPAQTLRECNPGFVYMRLGSGVLEQMALDVDEFAALGTSPWVVRGQRHYSLVL